MALVARRQYLRHGKLAGPIPPHGAEVGDGLADLRLAATGFRHQTGNRLSMARDQDGFAALHVIQQLRQVRLRVRCLNRAHARLLRPVVSTSPCGAGVPGTGKCPFAGAPIKASTKRHNAYKGRAMAPFQESIMFAAVWHPHSQYRDAPPNKLNWPRPRHHGTATDHQGDHPAMSEEATCSLLTFSPTGASTRPAHASGRCAEIIATRPTLC